MRSLAYFVGTFVVALMLGHRLGLVHDRARLASDDHQGRPLGRLGQRGQPQCRSLHQGACCAERQASPHLDRRPLFRGPHRQRRAALTSDCEYSIEGSPLNARWWSLAVYDEYGGLIDNPSARYSFNSEEMLRHADGTFRVNLSSNARPENWLPSGAADQHLVLLLRIYSPRETDGSGIGLIPGDRLPKIERKSCE